jgi:hypothetical protein
MFKKLILKRLNLQLRKLKVARNDHYALEWGDSITCAQAGNVESFMQGFNNNKTTVTLFLDIDRAFDKMWTIGLIGKRITAKIAPKLILNYLQKRPVSVMHRIPHI